MHTHVFGCFARNFWNMHTKFCGRSALIICNIEITHWLLFVYAKIDATPISGVSRIDAKLWHRSRGLKIGFASIFVSSHTSTWYVCVLYDKILGFLQNMGAELPVFRILHANPCARKTYPKMAYVLSHCVVHARFWV